MATARSSAAHWLTGDWRSPAGWCAPGVWTRGFFLRRVAPDGRPGMRSREEDRGERKRRTTTEAARWPSRGRLARSRLHVTQHPGTNRVTAGTPRQIAVPGRG